MTLYKWSQTAANNATADSTCPWPEGMAPSQVNDSARGNMAALAKYRDDISGAILTGGTATAYTVASYEIFDTLTHLGGQMIAFTPHTGNGGACTLNVDGLGAKPLRSSPGVELPAAVLVQGTPYVATYSATDGAFYLRGFFNLPYAVPVGALMPFAALTPPNSNFVLPYGQALSRLTYATLFALCGTTFGAGDGSTTFNIPDLRGRTIVAQDNMGGIAAGRVTSAGSGVDGTTTGASGGTQNKTLLRTDLPNASISAAITDGGHAHSGTLSTNAAGGGSGFAWSPGGGQSNPFSTNSATTGISAVFNLNGNVAQTLVNGMMPSIVLSYVLRVI
jgi:microcystin-dependent protein